MNPFLLVAGDFVTTGGMDQCNHALATFLADRGTETHLAAFRVDPQLAAHPNVVFHKVPKPLNSYFLGRPLLDRWGRAAARRIASRGGRVVVNGGNCRWPDINWIIHLHTRYKPVVAGSLSRRLKAEFEFRTAAMAERRALMCARVIISGSRATKAELIEDFGIPERRIQTVDLGINPAKYRIPTPQERLAARAAMGLAPETSAIAFVGAIGDRRKGFDTVYSAWKILCRDRDWDGLLVVIGSGFELPLWKERALHEGLGDKIRFMGFNPAPDFVAEILRGCDLMLAPTRYEGYGLAIQESVCSGVPAIASSSAPVTDRFQGSLSDLLMPDPENVSDLVDRIRKWHARRDEFQAQTIALSDRLRQWTWPDMAARITEIIEQGG